MPSSDASHTIDIAAPAETVYQLITDLDVLAELAQETNRMQLRRGARVEAGSVFRGTNRNGVFRWTTTCTVTDAAPGKRFAFEVTHAGLPVARWQYDLEHTSSGCRVTESTIDRRPGWFARLSVLGTGVADRRAANAAHIAATLQRLKDRAEAA